MLQLDAERVGEGARLQAGAPDQRVRRDHRPRLEGDAGRFDLRDHLAQQHLDAPLLQLLLGVGADLRPEHRHELRTGLDEDEARLALGDPRVVLGEVAAVQLGQSSGALDAGGPAADDDDGDRTVVHQGGVPVRRLPSRQDVLAEALCVGERVHRERVLLGALDAEEVGPGAEAQHEVVVGERRHLCELHLAAGRGRCR